MVSVVTLAALTACGGSTATQPNPVLFSSGPTFQGEAVITGQAVQDGTGSLTAEGFVLDSVDTVNVKVTVAGTSITTWTDSQGRFRLVNVPSGNVILQFFSNEVNANLTVPGVGATQQAVIQVQLGSATASIVTDERTELQKFNSVVTFVGSVAMFDGTVVLADGTTVVVDKDTWWDTGGDYLNVQDLQTAVQAGNRVKAKGQGTPNEIGQILASVIRAKLTDQKFEGVVGSADAEGTIVLLANEKGSITEVHVVDAMTIWNTSGDITNLMDLVTAVDDTNQLKVNIEGEGAVDAIGMFILAGKIKAEFVEAEFEGIVEEAHEVDPDDTIFLVMNEKGSAREVRVDSDTRWEGDISSLSDLIDALGGPDPVKVEGEGICGVNETFILATNIKAEVEVEEDEKDCSGLFSAQIGATEGLIA